MSDKHESVLRADINMALWENPCVTTESSAQQALWGSLHPTGLVRRIPGSQMECLYNRNYFTFISANKSARMYKREKLTMRLNVTINFTVVHHSHGLSCERKCDVLHAKSVIHFKAVHTPKSNQRQDKIK